MIFNHYSGTNWLQRMGTCSTACEGSRETKTELLTTINEKGGSNV